MKLHVQNLQENAYRIKINVKKSKIGWGVVFLCYVFYARNKMKSSVIIEIITQVK